MSPRFPRSGQPYAYHPGSVFGGGSIQLGRVFGIRIGVDVSWFFVLFLIIWSLSGYYERPVPGRGHEGVRAGRRRALLFFLSILLHELGHAVVAIRNGIPIPGIDLWMFGGVAKLERDTDSPGVEFRVAVAGPLVTLAIAALCFGLGALISSSEHASSTARRFETSADQRGDVAVLGYLTLDQRARAALQPDPRLPARRRPDRARDRLEAHRRPQPGHPLRRPARARRRLADGRRRRSDPARSPATRSAASGSPSSASSSPRPPARPRRRPRSPAASSTCACPT